MKKIYHSVWTGPTSNIKILEIKQKKKVEMGPKSDLEILEIKWKTKKYHTVWTVRESNTT
jgi:hypothetical protein